MFKKKGLIFLTALIVSLAACAAPLSKQTVEPQSKNSASQSEMREIVAVIKNKPDWLETNDVCPVDIIPAVEKDLGYLEENCENSPQLCFENCRKENAGACYELAISIQRKLATETPETIPLFFRACKLGIISGCTNTAAGRLSINSGDQKASKCIADTFEKTCSMNDPWGCTMYGKLLVYGYGREKNLFEAVKYLEKACKRFGSEDAACQNAMQVKEEIEQSKKKD